MHNSLQELLKDITIPTQEQTTQAPPVLTVVKEQPTYTETVEKVTPKKADAPPVDLSPEVLNSSADLVIGIFDFSQHNLFRALGNRKKKRKISRLYGDDAPDKLEKLLNQVDALENNKASVVDVPVFTTQDYGLLRIEKAANEYLADLPFSDYEKEALKIPLMELMKKRGGTIPPEIALILAVVQITGARATQLMLI